MKCFEKVCGNSWVLEPDKIIFDGMETENINATVICLIVKAIIIAHPK